MSKQLQHTSSKTGLPPGALVYVGMRKSEKTRMSVLDYNEKDLTEIVCDTPEESFSFRNSDTTSWINLDGLQDTETIEAIGNHFGLHSLLLEDVLNTKHRPKMEDFGDCLFLIVKMLGIGENGPSIVSEQVSLVLGKNWVISFQEREGDIFDALRQRIRESKGTIRQKGADYLLYRLIDTVVDNYFFVTEYISEATEKLEEKILLSPDIESFQEIQRLKKQLTKVRKAVNPLRDVVAGLMRDTGALIQDSTTRYLRDVYDHVIQVNDTIETQRDALSSIAELYRSGVSNSMNQVMQVLTVIATIFIPLTFIAGVYGMNFENMPELHWKYGYFGVWGIMAICIVIMLVYFRKKRWL